MVAGTMWHSVHCTGPRMEPPFRWERWAPTPTSVVEVVPPRPRGGAGLVASPWQPLHWTCAVPPESEVDAGRMSPHPETDRASRPPRRPAITGSDLLPRIDCSRKGSPARHNANRAAKADANAFYAGVGPRCPLMRGLL